MPGPGIGGTRRTETTARRKKRQRKPGGFQHAPTGLGIQAEVPNAEGTGTIGVKVTPRGTQKVTERTDFLNETRRQKAAVRRAQMDAAAETIIQHGGSNDWRVLFNVELQQAMRRVQARRAARVPGVIEKAIADVAYMPLGIGMAAAAPIGDVSSGDFTFPRSREFAKQAALGTVHSLLHPTDDPFLTALTIWGGAGVVGGTAARLGAAGRAMAESGALAAIKRPGVQGGSLLHAPHPGTYELTKGGAKVEVPLSRNPTWRPVQKGRLKLQQRALDKPPKPTTGRLGELTKEFSASASFARHRRAAQRIEFDIRRAPYYLAEPDLAYFGKRTAKGWKVDPGRNLAGIAVGIFGKEALDNPGAVIASMTTKHADLRNEIATELTSSKLTPERRFRLNEQLRAQDEILAALPLALKVLAAQEPKFLRAVEAARMLSDETAQTLSSLGFLEREVAEGRLKAMRAIYSGAKFVPDTVASRIAQGASPKSFVGKQVVPHDRYNIGRIASIDETEGVAWVEFYNRLTRARGATYIDLNDMHLRGERGGQFRIGLDPLPDSPPPEGAFYFPMRREYTSQRVEPVAGIGQLRTEIRATGQAKPGAFPGMSKRFTGASLRDGFPSLSPTLGDRFLRAQRKQDALDFWESLYSMASPVKLSEWDIPLREKSTALELLRLALSRAQRHYDIDGTELGALPAELVADLDAAFNLKGKVSAGVGEHTPGVVWVDGRLIKQLVGPKRDTRAVDAINNPVRIMTLYLRPAYALNALGNLAMGLVTEGPLAFKWARQGMMAKSVYGPKNFAELKSIAGEGRALGTAVETGFLHGASQQLAVGWNKFADQWFRVGTVLFHADRLGYRGKAGIDELLRRENGRFVHQDDINQIGALARKDAVDFNSLTPLERELIRHIVYFYPWWSRGAVWGLRAAKEHPIKTGVAAQLGSMGANEAERRFGTRLPWWALLSGLTPLTKAGKDERVLTVNPASVWTPITTAQTTAATVGLGKGLIGVGTGKDFRDALTPAAEATLTALVGGERTAPGLLGVVQSLPQYAALQRLGVLSGAGPTFPERGPWAAGGPLLIGGLAPRPADVSQLSRQRAREGSEAERARHDIRERRRALRADLKRIGIRETKYLAKAWAMQERLAIATAGRSPREKVAIAAALAVDLGMLDQEAATKFLRRTSKWTDDKLRLRFDQVSDLLGGAVLTRARTAVSAALRQRNEEPTEPSVSGGQHGPNPPHERRHSDPR